MKEEMSGGELVTGVREVCKGEEMGMERKDRGRDEDGQER